MPDLGKAYVQIVPSAKGMTGGIKRELEGAGTESGGGFGAAFGAAAKKLIAAAAIGATIKKSLDAGGAMQQSFGGLDTLYEDAAEGAKKYAYEAAKAGISANAYAEQAVSFGAALKAAYGGDTQKAMEAANTAILDMADNSAKMGTPIENIQNAYQGFAKQNYTMLDNLKLGYGGTKKEMERLLADAEKISGVEYNLDNLGDVYDAIHVIQENLHLTGVAADEAKGTFTGSFAAMKASAENLLANLSLGKDISEPFKVMVESGKNFLLNNLAPMIGNIFKQLPTLLSGISEVGGELLKDLLTGIKNNASSIAETAKTLIVDLITGLASNLGLLITAGIEITKALIEGLSEVNWAEVGRDILNALKEGMNSIAKSVMGDAKTLDEFIAGINEKLPSILDKGIEIITNLVSGIMQSMPTVIEKGGEVLLSFAKGILEAMPTLLTKGKELIEKLCTGITQNLPEIGTKAGEVVGKFGKYLVDHYPEIIQKGIELIGALIAGIIKAIPKVIEALYNFTTSMKAQFKETDWHEVGQDILAGVCEGLVAVGDMVWNAVKEAAQNIWNSFCSWFGIPTGGGESTKTKTIGKGVLSGILTGIKDSTLLGSIANAASAIYDTISGKITTTGFESKGNAIMTAVKNGLGSQPILNQIAEAAANLVETAKNAISDNPFYTAGTGLGGALIRGMQSKQGELNNAVQQMINQAEAAAKPSNDLGYLASKMGGSLSAESEDMYGSMDDNTSLIIDLLAQYLPAIAANDSYSINRINRELGYGMI